LLPPHSTTSFTSFPSLVHNFFKIVAHTTSINFVEQDCQSLSENIKEIQMFRRLFGFGLFILLLMALFGGLSGRTRAAYYEGYAAGLQAQASESSEEGAPTAPPAAPYYDDYGHGRFFGWGAMGILGIFAIFFKIGFFFLLAMLFLRLVFGRRWRHRRGPWGRDPWRHGPWGHHQKHGHHKGHEKSPKWMNDSDDDEPVMTV
jgi:hypothetical protein